MRFQQPPTREPKTDETWVFCPKNKSPWPDEDTHLVHIRDVKDGWVRYSMGSVFNDERKKMDSFLHMYAFKETTP